ncbi:MAG: hypothetical protein ACREH8_14855 [Opitutaceae bacterium]
MKSALLPLFTIVLLTMPVFAADPATVMTERGALLFSDTFVPPVKISAAKSLGEFARGKFDQGWRVEPGKWEFVAGTLVGAQVPKLHSAVASHLLPAQDFVLQFDLRMDGARRVTLRVNDLDEHICRVVFESDGFSTQKDDHDHTGPDQPVPFGKIPLPIKPGEWKTVVVEIVGDELVVTTEGRTLAGAHPLIGTKKANFGFVVPGQYASFRNVRIWAAKPRADWPQRRAALMEKP